MASKSFILSSEGLKNMILNDDEDFSFIIGDQTIKMKKLLVEFLSPRISNILKTDPTINLIDFNQMIQQNDNNLQLPMQVKITQETISHIENLLRGEKIKIKEGEEKSLCFLSILLGNEEMYNKINELYASDKSESNIDKYLEELKFFANFTSLFTDFNYSSAIDIIASNFYLIDHEKLLQLPKSIIYSIVSNDHLKLDDEDDLFDFINSIFSKNEEEEEEFVKAAQNDDDISITMFYEKIEFYMLTEWKFLDFLDNFNYTEMTNDLWRNFVKCFHLNYQDLSVDVDEERYKIQFNYDDEKDNCMDGIINHCNSKNIFNSGIDISSSSKHNNYYIYSNDRDEKKYNIYNVIDFDNEENYYETENKKNSWIMFDFKDKNVRTTYYTIKSSPSSSNYLKSWCFEGSKSAKDNEWEILDSQDKLNIFDNYSLTHTFKINAKNDCYRYLRIRQTGINMNSNYILSMSAIEFFGDINLIKQ